MPETIFDQKEQLDQVKPLIIEGEVLDAVLDLKGTGTGFLGITSKRLILYDRAFLRKMKAVVSIPYSRILSIGAQDDDNLLLGRGFFSTSKLAIKTSDSDYEFEFRGADKAHLAHKLILTRLL
jgi:hypothetical protein